MGMPVDEFVNKIELRFLRVLRLYGALSTVRLFSATTTSRRSVRAMA